MEGKQQSQKIGAFRVVGRYLASFWGGMTLGHIMVPPFSLYRCFVCVVRGVNLPYLFMCVRVNLGTVSPMNGVTGGKISASGASHPPSYLMPIPSVTANETIQLLTMSKWRNCFKLRLPSMIMSRLRLPRRHLVQFLDLVSSAPLLPFFLPPYLICILSVL